MDDSVSFQVYNQVESQESTDQAVQETKGQIMLYEGRPVKAYYFATSCGVTTDEAIWEDADPTKTPYIEGRRTGNGSLKKVLRRRPFLNDYSEKTMREIWRLQNHGTVGTVIFLLHRLRTMYRNGFRYAVRRRKTGFW